jgi:hypothetical protein
MELMEEAIRVIIVSLYHVQGSWHELIVAIFPHQLLQAVNSKVYVSQFALFYFTMSFTLN